MDAISPILSSFTLQRIFPLLPFFPIADIAYTGRMRQAAIIAALRTPVGRYGGALSTVRPDDLAALVIRAVIDRSGIAPELIDDIYFGAANQAGEDNRNVARMAALIAGLPDSVPGATVNRLCASGLEAINIAARLIEADHGDVFIAGGVESMSRAPFVLVEIGDRVRPQPRVVRHHHRLALHEPGAGPPLPPVLNGRDGRERGSRPPHQPRGSGPLRPLEPAEVGGGRLNGPVRRRDRSGRGTAAARRADCREPRRASSARTPRSRSWPPCARPSPPMTRGR